MDISDYIQDNGLDLNEVELLHLLEVGKIQYVKRIENQPNLIPGVEKPVLWSVEDGIDLPDDVLLVDQYDNGRCPGCYSILEGR